MVLSSWQGNCDFEIWEFLLVYLFLLLLLGRPAYSLPFFIIIGKVSQYRKWTTRKYRLDHWWQRILATFDLIIGAISIVGKWLVWQHSCWQIIVIFWNLGKVILGKRVILRHICAWIWLCVVGLILDFRFFFKISTDVIRLNILQLKNLYFLIPPISVFISKLHEGCLGLFVHAPPYFRALLTQIDQVYGWIGLFKILVLGLEEEGEGVFELLWFLLEFLLSFLGFLLSGSLQGFLLFRLG